MEQAVEKIANIIFSYFEANGWEYEYEKKTNRIFTGFMIDCELKKFNIVLNVFNTEVILEAFAKKFIDNDDEETWQSMETFAGWASRRLTCGKFCVFPEYRFFSFRIDILCPNAFLAEDTLELAVMRAEEAMKIYGEDFLDLGTKTHTLDEVKKDA